MLFSSLSSSEAEHLGCSGTLTAFTLSMRSLKDATTSPLFSWCYDGQISSSGQKHLRCGFGATLDRRTVLFCHDVTWSSLQGNQTGVGEVMDPLQLRCRTDDGRESEVKTPADRRVDRTHQWTLHVCCNVHAPPRALAAHKFYRFGLNIPHLRGYHAEQQESWTKALKVPQASLFLLEHVWWSPHKSNFFSPPYSLLSAMRWYIWSSERNSEKEPCPLQKSCVCPFCVLDTRYPASYFSSGKWLLSGLRAGWAPTSPLCSITMTKRPWILGLSFF